MYVPQVDDWPSSLTETRGAPNSPGIFGWSNPQNPSATLPMKLKIHELCTMDQNPGAGWHTKIAGYWMVIPQNIVTICNNRFWPLTHPHIFGDHGSQIRVSEFFGFPPCTQWCGPLRSANHLPAIRACSTLSPKDNHPQSATHPGSDFRDDPWNSWKFRRRSHRHRNWKCFFRSEFRPHFESTQQSGCLVNAALAPASKKQPHNKTMSKCLLQTVGVDEF